MLSNWPEREGDTKAIFLMQSKKGKHLEYEVYEQNETNGPWYEGTKFYLSDEKPIENHLFIVKYHVDGNGNPSKEIVAIAHKESEVESKTYECAVKYCEKITKAIKGKFINKTKRGLEQLAQSEEHPFGE